MQIYIKGEYTILGEIDFDYTESNFHFEVPVKNKPTVLVELIPNQKIIESIQQYNLSQSMWNILQSEITDGSDLPLNQQIELKELTYYISQATYKVLQLIKYCLYQIDLEGTFSTRGHYWSIDKENWKLIPRLIYETQEHKKVFPLNKESSQTIQKYLTEGGPQPLIALQYLHKAKKKWDDPKSRWIDATIAAELAIKEFLILLEPKIEHILLEIPAPPLHKLYGIILESYTKVRSPKLKALNQGAFTRNLLVHRPQDIMIDTQETINYISDVEEAIYHLLSILSLKYPILKSYQNP